jgi:hypothetical protein
MIPGHSEFRQPMPKALSITLAASGIVAALAFVGVGYLIFSYFDSKPFVTFHVTSGHYERFKIGETKEQLLARLPSESYALDPKPAACPLNWLAASTISQTQRECLISTDTWILGAPGKSSCPEWANQETRLRFKHAKVVDVVTSCMVAE